MRGPIVGEKGKVACQKYCKAQKIEVSMRGSSLEEKERCCLCLMAGGTDPHDCWICSESPIRPCGPCGPCPCAA